jgi:hypothetical protein
MSHSLGYFCRRVGLLFVSDEDPLAGSDPGRKSHFPRRFSYNATPNRFSIDRSVVPLMPRRLAAPSAPDNTPFVSRKTRMMRRKALSRSVTHIT